MSAAAVRVPAPARPSAAPGASGARIRVGYLSLIVLLPLAALVWSSRAEGSATF